MHTQWSFTQPLKKVKMDGTRDYDVKGNKLVPQRQLLPVFSHYGS
jgi:hypothetical protein